eukprot:Nk52_evm6s553 gene=Nk52_evmTU6s553
MESKPTRESKVDSFFRRHLSHHQYANIRFYEECIISGDKGKSKAFHYLMLSGQALYLTEYPPKTIQGWIKLPDIIEIKLANDRPAFLSREEVRNCHHIVIHYYARGGGRQGDHSQLHNKLMGLPLFTPVGQVVSKLFSTKHHSDSISYSHSDSQQQLVQQHARRNNSWDRRMSMEKNLLGGDVDTPRAFKSRRSIRPRSNSTFSMLDDSETLTRQSEQQEELAKGGIAVSSTKRREGEQRGQKNSVKRASLTPNLQSTAKNADMGSRNLLIRQGTLDTILSSDNLTQSASSLNGREERGSSSRGSEGSSRSFSKEVSNEEAQHDMGALTQEALRKHNQNGTWPGSESVAPNTRSGGAETKPPLHRARSSLSNILGGLLKGNLSEMNLSGGNKKEFPLTERPSSKDFLTGDERKKKNYSNKPLPPLPGAGQHHYEAAHGQEGGTGEHSEDEEYIKRVDIYTFRENTALFGNLESALRNAIVRETASANTDIAKRLHIQRQNDPSVRQHLFNQIRNEILKAMHLEAKFDLVSELSSACEYDNLLKRFFWEQASDLYQFILKELESNASLNGSVKHKYSRADEIEFYVLLQTLLRNMLKDSENIPARVGLLLGGTHHNEFEKTIKLILSKPQVEEDKLTVEERVDIDFLLSDITLLTIDIVSELAIVCQQAGSYALEYRRFSLPWLMNRLFESENFKEHTLEAMVAIIIDKLSPNNLDDFLSSEDSLAIYQHFSLISKILQTDTDLSTYFRETYREEFKYFISNPDYHQKLNVVHPVNSYSRELIKKIIILMKL